MLLYQKTDSRALSSASGFGMFLLANKIANNYGDRTSKVIRIDLQGQLPGTRRNLEAVAGCRIRTDQPHDAWTLCGTALDRPFQCYNPLIARYARQRLDAKIRELNTLSGLSQTVRDKIRHHLQATPLAPPDGQILASLCDSLGTSRWTLRRHLSQEGCSFSELLTATRCEEMQRLLQYSELSIAAIGDQLGFATPGSLTRFARQHIGNSPSELRQITRKRPSVAPSFVLPNPLMPIVKAAAHSPCQVVARPGSADGSPPGPYPVRTGNSSWPSH
jgi:AraC-like DNA-binding protein